MDFKVYYDNQRKLIENFLETRMAKKGISKVDDAMAYSLLAGGTRIRPVLLMATAEALGKKGYNFLPVACGLGTEAEDIKKRWQEYTELYKQDLHDQGNHDGVITDLEPTSLNVKSSGP